MHTVNFFFYSLILTNTCADIFIKGRIGKAEILFVGFAAKAVYRHLVNKLVGKITSNEKVLQALESLPAELLSEGLEEIKKWLSAEESAALTPSV